VASQEYIVAYQQALQTMAPTTISPQVDNTSSTLAKVQAAYIALPLCVQSKMEPVNANIVTVLTDWGKIYKDNASGNVNALAADSNAFQADAQNAQNYSDVLEQLKAYGNYPTPTPGS
jgi:hypothetical protein